MTIEETVFLNRRFDEAKMLRAGFRRCDGGLRYETAFMNGEFHAILTVADDGTVSGSVVDEMNGEEYTRIRAEDDYLGTYARAVRNAYEELLGEIAGKCCRDVPFASEQANRITERIRERYGVEPDFPWDEDLYRKSGVFRHLDTGKWFALIMNVKWGALLKDGNEARVDALNLKVDPERGSHIAEEKGIYPAYHMNHKSWITVTLDDRQSDDAVMELIGESFRMTGNRRKAVGRK